MKVFFSPAFPSIQKSFALFEVSRASTFLCKMKVGVVNFWNGTDRGNPKFYEKNLSHCHFTHHKSHTESYGVEIEPLGREAGN